MRATALTFALSLTTATTATPLNAAELVLFEFDGCLWCEQWKSDVGTYYAETAEGQAAPLRVVDLFDKRPAHLRRLRPVRATPTFVLVDEGREIGRITGYTDAKAFWTDYGKMLANPER
jgi:thioredoxin-related protein